MDYDTELWLDRCAHWMLAHGTVNEHNYYGWDDRESWLHDMRREVGTCDVDVKG